jgi:hypothetical protein
MALAYGRETKSSDDPVVKAVIRCLTRLGNAVRPGHWRVDTYPFLRLVFFCFNIDIKNADPGPQIHPGLPS